MAVLDTLRGMYAVGGPRLKRVVGPALATVPMRYRLGQTYRAHRAFLQRAETDPEFVAEWRRTRSAELIQRAVRTRLYPEFWGEDLVRRVSAPSVDPLRAIGQLPILTRAVVSEHGPDMVDGDPAKLDIVTTSGSSGSPTRLFLPRGRGAIEWAFRQDAWARIGYREGDARGVLRGQHEGESEIVRWDPALRELRISVTHLAPDHIDDFCSELVRRKIQYLHGYPSAIASVASHVDETNHPIGRAIRGILTISEPLHPWQRSKYRKAFPSAEVSNFYGLTEKVLFGVEDPVTVGCFDLNPLYGVAELVDEIGNLVESPGSVGRLVGTGLLFSDMPLVRYETGDLAELVEPASPHNGFQARVRHLRPKKSLDHLVGKDGQEIPLHAFDTHLPAFSFARQVQFIQSTAGHAELLVIPSGNASGMTIQLLQSQIEQATGYQVTIAARLVEDIQAGARGKIPYVIQNCDLNPRAFG